MKEFLSQRGIYYDDRDVSKDEQALEELTKLGYLTTPVIKVGDDVVVGFDHAKLKALLNSL